MNNLSRLRKALLATVADMWPHANGSLRSEDIFTRLVANGEGIPEGAMNAVFEELKAEHLIRGAQPLNREAIKQHGGFVITWVDPGIL